MGWVAAKPRSQRAPRPPDPKIIESSPPRTSSLLEEHVKFVVRVEKLPGTSAEALAPRRGGDGNVV